MKQRRLGAVLERPVEKTHREQATSAYAGFDEFDGAHPWRDAVPDGYVAYPVRVLTHGRVAYFNFRLAKDMGLLSENHPEIIDEVLHEKLIETFSLQIINEYDQLVGQHFPEDTIKKQQYMATRYLQIQHADETGRTSGDGRSIWNGVWHGGGLLWDVSSRGTGVTALAPGAVEAGSPTPTGSEEIAYACGQIELDELLESALLSEIFFRRKIRTERVLAIIDIGDGLGIGVRAAPNLMRPAHCFLYARQGDRLRLERALDYLIERQHTNGEWGFSSAHPQKWDLLLDEISERFAEFAAMLDVDHVFVWAEWDGDNVLSSAGIIDYGSVRQFGLRHDEYRYNDVDRFSTTLSEQTPSIELLVKTFVQAVEFLRLDARPSFEQLDLHAVVDRFRTRYESFRLKRILHRVGFDDRDSHRLLEKHRGLVDAFAVEYDFIDREKTSGALRRTADGIDRQPLFNIRNLLRAYPTYLLGRADFRSARMHEDELFRDLVAREVDPADRHQAPTWPEHAARFQDLYKDLVLKSARWGRTRALLEKIQRRSQMINAANRATGNAISVIARQLLLAWHSGLSAEDVSKLIDRLAERQRLDPDRRFPSTAWPEGGRRLEHLQHEVDALLDLHSEDL